MNSDSFHVDCAWVSPDNLRMYYYTAGNTRRIMLTKRESIYDSWLPGEGIDELNALGGVANPYLTPDELTIFFTGTNVPGGEGGYDIWMARREDIDLPFTDFRNVMEINSSGVDCHPCIAPEGLTLFFKSDRNGKHQLFKANRESLNSSFFYDLEPLSFFDLPGYSLSYPTLTHDGTTFYFCRRLEIGMSDIYISYYSDNTYYVDAVNGDDSNNGRSFQTPFATIQYGIDVAPEGYTILVNPGTYNERIDFKGKALTIQGLAVSDGVPVLEVPDDLAVFFADNEGPDSILKNFVIRNSNIGIFAVGSSPTIRNVTIVDNVYGIRAFVGADPDISNCIFWNNLYGDLSDCISRYSLTAAEGEGNIFSDPFFVDAANGDYHLHSERGRYWPEHHVWVLDNIKSPCIDAGNPADDPSGEPMPNGGFINMGAYGGTRYASMSEMPWPDPDVNGDGVINTLDLEELVNQWLAAAGWLE